MSMRGGLGVMLMILILWGSHWLDDGHEFFSMKLVMLLAAKRT